MRIALLAASCVLALGGCARFPWDDPGLLATRRIGAEGGRIEAGDVALDVPAGALGETTEIRIRVADVEPEGIALLSPVYRFEPSGLTFSSPAQFTHQVPGASTGVLLWTRADDATRFELVSFIRDGVGVAEITHFSDAAAAEQATACTQHDESSCPHDECSHDDPPAGSPPPSVCRRGPSDAVLPIEPCRRLCHCQASDIGDHLCSVDPTQTGDREYDPRPCPEASAAIGNILANGLVERPAGGQEILARRNGEACNGFGLRPRMRHLCGCTFSTRAGPGPLDPYVLAPMCRRPWTDPTGTPDCSTTRDGLVPEDTLEEFATRGWTQEDDATCVGYYIDYNDAVQGPVTGVRQCDANETAVGAEWVALGGATQLCQLFGWPNGEVAAAGADINRSQCRLTDEQWGRVTERRDQCMVPQRLTPDEERASPSMTRYTTSILDVGGETGAEGITGLSRNAREAAATAGAMCRPAPDMEALYGYDLASQGTKGHAEGEALLQLAQQRGAPAPDGLSSQAGSGTMIVDRDPCAQSCARCGIDSARRVAGLSELTLHSPSGSIVYRDDYPPCGLRLDD